MPIMVAENKYRPGGSKGYDITMITRISFP